MEWSPWPEGIIASARQHLHGLPEIHFDFAYDGEINAIAFRSEGRYFIGVTTGAIYMIQLVLGRMLSRPDLFPKTGDPTEESEKLELLKGYHPTPSAWPRLVRGRRVHGTWSDGLTWTICLARPCSFSLRTNSPILREATLITCSPK